MHGRINISFWVKGTRGMGEVRLRCRRRGKAGLYVTQEWSLDMQDKEGGGGNWSCMIRRGMRLIRLWMRGGRSEEDDVVLNDLRLRSGVESGENV